MKNKPTEKELESALEKLNEAGNAIYDLGFKSSYPLLNNYTAPFIMRCEHASEDHDPRDRDFRVWNLDKMVQESIKLHQDKDDCSEDLDSILKWAEYFDKWAKQMKKLAKEMERLK